MPIQTGILPAGSTLTVDYSIGETATISYQDGDIGVVDNGQTKTTDRTIGPFANDVTYSIDYTGWPKVFTTAAGGAITTISLQLPDPASLPAGQVINAGGVYIESTGWRYIRSSPKDGRSQARLITGRNVYSNTVASPAATTRCWRVWKPFFAGTDVCGVNLTFANWYVSSGGVETDNTNPITIQVSLEKDGICYPVFFNGVRQVTLAGGVTITSDDCPLLLTASDEGFYVRTWVSVGSVSEKMLSNTIQNSTSVKGAGTGRWEGVAASFTDDMTKVTPSSTTSGEFGPVLVRGYAADGGVIPSVVIFGSSSAEGIGDAQQAPYYVPGYLARSLYEAKIPYVNLARAGETTANFLSTSGAKRRYIASLCKATHAINTYGSNDIAQDAATFEQCQVLMQRMKLLMEGYGMEAYMCTYTPSTSSTDAWATVANQTVYSPVRNQLSDWLRAQTGWKVIDLDVPSDSGLSAGVAATGKWRVDLGVPTTDGMHGTPVVHSAIAATLSYPEIRF